MSVTSRCPMAEGTVPIIDDDPFSAEVLEDPLPFQERLREAGPVALLSRYGVYAIGRFAELSDALCAWQDLKSGDGVSIRELESPKGLLQTDPPLHDAPREVLQEILSARALRGLRETCMARVDTLVDGLLADSNSGDSLAIDGHAQIAAVLPVDFFPDASGVDECARDKFVEFADHNFNTAGPYNDLVKAGERRAPELAAWLYQKCQREELKSEGFGADIWAAADRGDILHENAALLASSLITAGVDTTIYGISGLLYALATNPEQWEKLKANPSLARVAFDEALRWVSPVQAMFRTAARDFRSAGSPSPRAARCSCAIRRPTGIRAAGRTRTSSTCPGIPRATWPSAWVCTSAWDSTRPGCRRPACWRSCWIPWIPSSWPARSATTTTTCCAAGPRCRCASR